ncbi:MAG: hypothetical protein IAE78_08480 [Myxococcus sp.]|nr:hypothetical protein [Myxococcus sp.]
MVRSRLLVLWSTLALGCGRGAPEWPDPPTAGDTRLREAITGSGWSFRTITAAHCNDRELRWAFSADGGALATTSRDLLDANHTCTRPALTAAGAFTLQGRRLEATWAQDSRGFSAAAFEHAPRVINSPSRQIARGARALSTRAFEGADGSTWLDVHEQTKHGRRVRTSTRVVITPPLTPAHDGATCAMAVTVAVEVDGERATEAFSPPCVRLRDATTGWRAAGHLERLHHRWDAVREAGVLSRWSIEVAAAIADGFVMALAVQDEQPFVAVPPESSDEAIGWFEADPRRP